MERLAREAGVQFNHVPYKGAAPALNDLVGGHIEAHGGRLSLGAGHLRAGNIRPLAVCSAARLASLPDVPTVQEALGLDGFEAYAWQGLVVPDGNAGPHRRAALDRARRRARMHEHVCARMREIGLEPIPGGPAEMQRLIDAERAVWVPLIKSLGITLD